MSKLQGNSTWQTNAVLCFIFVCTIVGSSCYISDSFMESSIVPKWITFYIGTGLIFILVSLSQFRKGIYFNYYDLMAGGIAIGILIFLLFKATQLQDALNWSVFCCFCIACKLCSSHIDVQKIASISFISSAVISSFFSVKQILEYDDITGCYDNLVGLNITLLLGILSILYLLRSCVFKKSYRIILCLVMLLFIILALMTKSRLVFLALAVGGVTFFPKAKKTIIVLALSFLCLITYFDSKKQESSYGRGFIIKTSMSLLDSPNKLLTGYGESGFKLNYMTRQSERLEMESDASKQRASNIVHPLNEFILMSVKYGIPFTALILLLLSFPLIGKTTTSFSKAVILVLITYALFSYPLKYPISLIAICVAVGSNARTAEYNRQYKFTTCNSIVLLLIGIVLIAYASNTIWKQMIWKEAYTYAVMGRKQQALYKYNNIQKYMSTDDFIYNYSSYLHNLGKNVEAKSLLSEMDMVDYESKMLSGKINESMQLYEDALEDFNIAYGMCPNRFSPLFEIYKIYEKTNNEDGQRKYSELIRNKKIKIPSSQVSNIIEYVTITK